MSKTSEISKLRPLNDNVLIRRNKADEVTKGGIVLPDSATKEKSHIGIVQAIGPGGRNDKTGKLEPIEGFAVTDEVVFNRYAGQEIEIEGEPQFLVRAQDIIGVIG